MAPPPGFASASSMNSQKDGRMNRELASSIATNDFTDNYENSINNRSESIDRASRGSLHKLSFVSNNPLAIVIPEDADGTDYNPNFKTP